MNQEYCYCGHKAYEHPKLECSVANCNCMHLIPIVKGPEPRTRLQNEALIFIEENRPDHGSVMCMGKQSLAELMAAFTEECIRDLAKVMVKEYGEKND